MDKLKDLNDLLKHEIEDLYSAEQQIIDALPAMIEKAGNQELKKALNDHLRVTKKQKSRLDEALSMLNGSQKPEEKRKGFLSVLFGGSGIHKCKGTEGLIQEGEKIMAEDMNPEVMDAAIIASAQKIEHYEICGYGTARAYARELGLSKLETLLTETLNEEYAADDLLTSMAVRGGLNQKAEQADQSAQKKSATAKKAAPAPAKKKPPQKKAAAKKTTAPKKAARSTPR